MGDDEGQTADDGEPSANAERPDTSSALSVERLARLRLLGGALLVTLFVAHALYAANAVVVDDAYIAFRYSKSLASGLGLSFQGGAPVEGYTCFTWVLLGALGVLAGLEPAVLLPLVGIVFGAATVLSVLRAAWRAGTELPPAFRGWLPALYLVACPSLAYYSASGLETGLFAWLVVAVVSSALRDRAVATGLWGALALATRPEGAVVAMLGVAAGWSRKERGQRQRWLVAGALVLTSTVLLTVFRWFYFGALVPNTATAKPANLEAGISYVAWGLMETAPLLLLTLVALLSRRPRESDWLWAFGIGMALFFVAGIEGGDWMTGGRMLVPGFAAVALSLDALVLAATQGAQRARLLFVALGACAVVFYGYFSVVVSKILLRTARDVAHYEPFRDDVAHKMLARGVRSLGTLDIGRISHTAPEIRIFDLGGLTDRDIARAPGDYRSKHIPRELLAATSPDAFLISARKPPQPGAAPASCADLYYPVERDLIDSAWFQQSYALFSVLPVRANYYLCWYERRDRLSPESAISPAN